MPSHLRRSSLPVRSEATTFLIGGDDGSSLVVKVISSLTRASPALRGYSLRSLDEFPFWFDQNKRRELACYKGLARRPHSTEAAMRRVYLPALTTEETFNKKQRRKINAELRDKQQLVPVHPSNMLAQEPEANVPTWNKFIDLRWVKRNNYTRELKKFFRDRQPEVPAPPRKKEPETLSARVYRIVKRVKDRD
ncbi:hypothetical protein MA16_Dca008097 [Dendrobium catenatum]|uniref:Uncharacterized protein n=1 Tax=Dendrobium catenatum TaxID=906689 RepID=A0A2I0WD08_9ASPA|nr:hypothetical protein MA16_Dca008097 [Dendrobium catenatum]